MCFLPLKSSHYPSRPVPVPELFGKYPTRPVPKSKTPTRRTLATTTKAPAVLEITYTVVIHAMQKARQSIFQFGEMHLIFGITFQM